MKKDIEKAKEAFQKALEKNTDSKDAKEWLDFLKSLENTQSK